MLTKPFGNFNIEGRSPLQLKLAKTIIDYIKTSMIDRQQIIDTISKVINMPTSADVYDEHSAAHQFSMNGLFEEEVETAIDNIAKAIIQSLLYYKQEEWNELFVSLASNLSMARQDIETIVYGFYTKFGNTKDFSVICDFFTD